MQTTLWPVKKATARPTTQREKWSQWMTPEWAASLIVERYFSDLDENDFIFEPSCGVGSFLKAIPPHVPAIGVEIDAELAAIARANSGRTVYVGDFRTIDLKESPTAIIGNPPYKVSVIEGFLGRAADLLPDDGRCGLLLPAYAMQTHRTVMRWHQTWSMSAEIVPRRLFPRLSLPLVFVQFRKEKVRTMVGFALYAESVEFEGLQREAKNVLRDGRPRRSVWRALVEATLERLGGQASLSEIYKAIESKRPTSNQWWKEKVRQTLQIHCHQIERGYWALQEAA